MSTSAGLPIRLPDPNGLSTALSGLLGISTFVTKAQAPLLFTVANRRAYAALYVTAEGFCSSVVACDIKLAACAGGAIVEYPPEEVNVWIRAGRLSDDGPENLREVLNVLSSTFNDTNPGRHVRLWGMLEPGKAVPKRTVPLFAKGVMRADFDVEVDGYAKGKMTVFSAP